MKKILLSSAIIAAVFFAACKKDDTLSILDINEMLVASSEDVSDAEATMQTSEDQADADIEGAGGGGTSSCPTKTFSAPRGTFPQTITLDFGTSCVDRNGHVRKGKIVIALSDSLSRLNATKTVTYQNYFIDSTQIEGTRTWKNTGANASGQPTFTRTATNMKVTFGGGTFATWSAAHVVTKIQGAATLTPLDDVWSVTGNASGINRKNKEFTSTITTPLVHKATCAWIVSGVRSVTVNDRTRSLDYSYGGGDCDRQALLTFATGDTRVINLRR